MNAPDSNKIELASGFTVADYKTAIAAQDKKTIADALRRRLKEDRGTSVSGGCLCFDSGRPQQARQTKVRRQDSESGLIRIAYYLLGWWYEPRTFDDVGPDIFRLRVRDMQKIVIFERYLHHQVQT